MRGAGTFGSVVDLPLARVGDPVDRIRRGTPGPQHVRGIQHNGERPGHIGTAQPARCDRLRVTVATEHLIDGGPLEAVQQLTDRLVHPGDTGDRRGAGNDAHLVSVVAGVMGLPQRVTAPPAPNVLVDDGHKVDRLAKGLAQRHKERHVRRVQLDGLGVRVTGQQCGDGLRRILQQRRIGECGLDGTEILWVQTRFGALQHLLEPVSPGVGQPRAARRGGVSSRIAFADSQFDVALQPLQICHVGDVAEVRLGGLGHRGDDLVATLGDRIRVSGHLVEQLPATRRAVVDLVDVRTELATAGSHAALSFSGADPLTGALGFDQHLLDRRRGGGLQCGHGGGADQDPVDRHQREAIGLRPAPGQVLGRALRGTDATADADGDVGARPQLRIGRQQQVVEVFPGMVATGAPTFDVHDHRLGGHLGGNADHRADLLDGAGLEHHVADSDVVEFVDQLDGFFEVRDARADHHTIDCRAGLARLLHQPLATELELPQVGIEEQCIELIGAPRLEQTGHLVDAVGEDLLGDLPAAGQLGPVPSVGRRGDDLGVHGGGRHAREQDRRPTGQPSELRRELHPAVGETNSGRGITRPGPGNLGRGSDGEEVALAAARCRGHDADAQAPDHRRGQPGQDVTGPQVQDPACAGLVDPVDVTDPVHRVNQDRLGQLAGQGDVEANLFGPAAHNVNSVRQPRSVEAHLDLYRIEHGREDIAAADLALALGFFFLRYLAAIQLEARQLLGGAGDDDRTPTVADGQHGRKHGAHVLGEVLQQLLDALGVGVGDRNHRRAIAEDGYPTSPGHQRSRRTDQLSQGQQLHVARPTGVECLHRQHALRVPHRHHRRGRNQVHTLACQGADGCDLGKQHARQRHRRRCQVLVGRDWILSGQRTYPLQRLEADRADHNQFLGHRLEQQLDLAHQGGQF